VRTNLKETKVTAAPYPTNPAANAAADPGRTMGIVGLVLSIFVPIVGLIVSIIARRKSKLAGFANTLALVGIIIGVVFTVLGLGGTTAGIVAAVHAAHQCAALGPGVHHVGSTTYTCGG
jgi:hypothetical protein